MTGLRLGWLLGGLGGLLWLPIMAAIRMAAGRWLWTLPGLAIFLAGSAYLWFLAPWRFPRVPMRRLYLGFLGILLAGGVTMYLEYRDTMAPGETFPWPILVVFLIPLVTLGRRSWADLEVRKG